MERNVLLTIAYDGSHFCGWQRQPAVRTVQGVLEDALSKLCAMEVRLQGVSRTDAGVHALGQRATFSGDFGIPIERIPLAANRLLAAGSTYRGKSADVRILDAREMRPGFHARFDACGKRYRYLLDHRKEPDLFRRDYVYHVPEPLNVAAMQEAARHLIGTHDFVSFQASGGTPRETTVRTIHRLDVMPQPDGQIWIEVTGDGFLYNMVRIITGTLVDVGRGRRDPAEIPGILAAADRNAAGHTAPAEGLYLVEVYYQNDGERDPHLMEPATEGVQKAES